MCTDFCIYMCIWVCVCIKTNFGIACVYTSYIHLQKDFHLQKVVLTELQKFMHLLQNWFKSRKSKVSSEKTIVKDLRISLFLYIIFPLVPMGILSNIWIKTLCQIRKRFIRYTLKASSWLLLLLKQRQWSKIDHRFALHHRASGCRACTRQREPPLKTVVRRQGAPATAKLTSTFLCSGATLSTLSSL